MKKLTLIRHAKSSWSDPSLPDHERPLNERGRRDAPFMAQLMASRGWRPDRLISSTAVRAYLTAQEFARALGLPETDIQREARIYEASVLQLQYLIQELDQELDHVALFGHNPAFGMLAASTQQDTYLGNFSTCGIAEIDTQVTRWADFQAAQARLVAYHYPKQYQ
ncbi:MAG: histidine phosphatase family protein [Bacteroidetes bacterium]|nr:MAG: histidine phosphatase family protein [Bacteroidota bacterium]